MTVVAIVMAAVFVGTGLAVVLLLGFRWGPFAVFGAVLASAVPTAYLVMVLARTRDLAPSLTLARSSRARV